MRLFSKEKSAIVEVEVSASGNTAIEQGGRHLMDAISTRISQNTNDGNRTMNHHNTTQARIELFIFTTRTGKAAAYESWTMTKTLYYIK